MDHARKIGKPEQTTVWTKKRPTPPSSITDKPLIKDKEPSEERRLANWRKWLNDRKKHYKQYSKSTDRDCQDLLINTPDTFRRQVEMKELAEIAVRSTNKKIDKYEGDPGFWVTPEFLPNRGNPDLPDVSITLSKKQLNVTSQLERVALPELTQQEKGLSFTKKQTPLWKRSDSSKTLGAKVVHEIKSFEAREIELRKLAVRGTSLGQRKLDSQKVPITTITGPEPLETKEHHKSLEEVVIALKIQDREIKFVNQGESRKQSNAKNTDDLTWSLIFKSSGTTTNERIIRLENLGTFAITYRWRCASSASTLMPQITRISPFYFNKNKGIILPGQVIDLRVWFRSQVPCSATESWKLITEPKLCCSSLVFRFWGCCNPSTMTLNTDPDAELDDSIDRYLDRRIRDTKIQDIIQEILDNVRETRLPSPAYGSLFAESEIFETKNPSHFYHPTVVQQLRDVYENSTSDDSPPWSLALSELRGVIVKLGTPETMNSAFSSFSELCRECLKPSLYNPLGSTKGSTVNNLLCSFLNKFEAEDEFVKIERSSGPSAKVKGQSEGQGDETRSNSASRISEGYSTPTRKSSRGRLSSRPKTASSKTSITTVNQEIVLQTPEKQIEQKCPLHEEVFYIRIRAMLVDTLYRICGAVDTLNNLN